MNFRFHILDRDNVSTEIEEPVGFDALTCEISRDADWHGIFFTNSGETFEYYDVAYKLLKEEYETYGAQGNMTLIMEEECAGVWTEFDRGQFVFSKYEGYNDDCYVKCPLEAVGEVMDLRNRVDQKVNLESLKAFDETTDLVAYDKLAFDLGLPSKGIFMQNKAEWTIEETTTINLQEVPTIKIDGFDFNKVNYAWFEIVPQYDKNDLSEFGTFTTPATPEHHFIKSGWYDGRRDLNYELVVNGVVDTAPDRHLIYFNPTASALLVNEANANNFDAVDSFSLDVGYSFDVNTTAYCSIVALYKIVVIWRKNGTYEYLSKDRIFSGRIGSGQGGYDISTIYGPSTSNNVSFTGSYPSVSLSDGDYLFVAVCGIAMYKGTDVADAPDAYSIVSKSGSVNMQTLTHFAESKAKVYAVNEVISRISESVTNDKLRAYSEYFGRTDSQPYAVAEDGCGALEVITNGLRIRQQENKTPGQTDVFSQSLDDIFKGLGPIHNIGMGIEPDTNRTGFNRLRVEPWNFFYNDTLVMSCTGIDTVTRKANDKEIYSIFQFGYDKWEAEQYNGLDELLTKRNYRTALSQVKNTLAQISKFISSGYALEVTRRKGNDNTKDWRYDNDVFIVCVTRTRNATFSATFTGNHIFDLFKNTMIVDYVDDPATLTVSSINIQGTVNNNGTKDVNHVSFSNGKAIFHFNEGVITDEESDSVTFPDIVFPAGIFAELGNVTNPLNIVDPDTLYNFRISPVRNAMRWMNKVLASYRQFDANSKILFTDGDGNYFAQGEMTDSNCRLEGAALTENQTIDSSAFAVAADAKPILFPERVTFTYPFTAQDYVNIKANPVGKIYFESLNDSGYGWIDSIQWNPKEGTATFSLIPKFTN